MHVLQNNQRELFHGVALSLGGYNISHTDWPPGAADISFSLRRVIIDSLDQMGRSDASDENRRPRSQEEDNDVWLAAESRLGFGLRDIPNDAIAEGWFNPDNLE
jgi:hypothetical protein